MPIAGGIAVIVVGAILTFALTTESMGGLDLHIVGVILMLAGAVGLLLPVLVGNRPRSNRPTARSRQDAIDDGPQTPVGPAGYDHSLNDDRRTPNSRRPWARKGRG
jgi:hypothetical protein